MDVEMCAGFERWTEEGRRGVIRVLAGDGEGANGAHEAGQQGEEGGGRCG